MSKATPPDYRKAKAAALAELAEWANVDPDAPLPDRVEFGNEESGFRIRLRVAEQHYERMLLWEAAREGKANYIEYAVRRMMHELARSQ